jgi:hypothetical protein
VQSEDPGTLCISAGIGGGPNNDPMQSHGLLASIQAVPYFATSGIQNAASVIAGPIPPNTWVQIKGNGLSAMTSAWQVTGSTLPTEVNGVGVTLSGHGGSCQLREQYAGEVSGSRRRVDGTRADPDHE